ncbi:4-hydroxy-tetrahydrodipicolinate reductase [Anaeromyxobacter dehalogenans]|uniref:4-hydroxy-tetrahydrodipicolinate reductase n=1 Tax=Anaeromyxobacter dehalogenans (strain 2CP-C) TaxID=290397 RepID=DAPB_ANADE|nr:4-hydroxy-tetrahydrodipicolinate reductase [Anaeromyxobacter dehalogenans]Q2IGX0.1 RecName: Full=4-hydroxy-tetrahydrodipicolinate reductase; Short=HTPA reductase [Anaeromyxobacter dehalogenans 2CP-C]ABC83832.1 dihydrodipicolinate reductase [Anaeromyxobacter dehalogenans 2CP-C]
MTKVVVTGAAGRMGTQIVRLVRATPGLSVSGAVERAGSPAIGKDAGTLAGGEPLGVAVVDDLAKALPGADVVIDFTSHEASVRHAQACAAAGVALVIGSTGFTPDAKAKVAEAARKVPVVLSPNMSVGVNVVFELVRQAARVLGDAYDVEVVEIHHKHKRDAPSGTAVRLGEVAAEALGRAPADALAYSRHGILGERPPWQIGIQTLRGGDVVGEHTVFFCGEGERVEITHRATSREQFARGAARAAAWLPGKAPGVYDMADVLGLRGGK